MEVGVHPEPGTEQPETPSVDVGDIGSGESFEAFAGREFSALVGLAYTLCGDRGQAPDLAQNALLAAYRKWDRIRQLDQPGAWVRKVVANQASSVVRRQLVEVKVHLRLRNRRQVAEMAAPEEGAEWLWALVRELPKRQRQVVALHYVEQLTLDEIADVLEISKGSVNTHLRRARSTLSEKINNRDIS